MTYEVKRFDEGIKWYNKGKLGPEINSESYGDLIDGYEEITPYNIEVGLDIYSKSRRRVLHSKIEEELFGTITNIDENMITIQTQGNSKFVCGHDKIYKYGFLKKV